MLHRHRIKGKYGVGLLVWENGGGEEIKTAGRDG